VENRSGRYEITHNRDNRVTEGKVSGYPVMPVIDYSGASQSVQCIHGYQEGTGCYLCDPEHPPREEEECKKGQNYPNHQQAA